MTIIGASEFTLIAQVQIGRLSELHIEAKPQFGTVAIEFGTIYTEGNFGGGGKASTDTSFGFHELMYPGQFGGRLNAIAVTSSPAVGDTGTGS